MKADAKTKKAGAYDPLPKEAKRGQDAEASKTVMQVLSLSEMLSYEKPPGHDLVGESIIECGEIALLFGPPGSFKGFAVGHLMAAGAWGHGRWMGHEVRAKFASLWLNCENGRSRLRKQFEKMKLPPDAEEYIHATDIPSVWSLSDARLAAEIRSTIMEKNIRLLIVDTVSNFCEDEMAKHFAAFFAALNTILTGLECKPAVLLIHHSRKPKDGDKGGRGLLNLISGHQMVQRRARTIFFIGRVTDDFTERRIATVLLKCSNNGEAEGQKKALALSENSTLEEIEFDWSEWEGGDGGGAGGHNEKITEKHIRALFDNGQTGLLLKDAVPKLMALAGCESKAVYAALGSTGRFAHLLRRDGKFIELRCEEDEAEAE